MKKETKILILGSVSAITGIFLLYRTIKRKQTFDSLVTQIKGNSTTLENVSINKALRGSYHTSLNTSKPFVKLKDIYVQQKSEKLRNAFAGTTDESAIRAVMNSLNDKVALSQISAFYSARHNEDFFDRLDSELTDAEMNEVITIMALKPDVRWLN